jgi:hypothetical protein
MEIFQPATGVPGFPSFSLMVQYISLPIFKREIEKYISKKKKV